MKDQYKVQTLTREKIRLIAGIIRRMLGLENLLYFPVVEVLEGLHILDKDAHFEVVRAGELLDPDAHAETDIVNKCIKIREDVYDAACAGSGRDRMTIAHELGHFVLMILCGVKLYRIFDGECVRAYNDPEWQAKCFAGELMIAKHLVMGMSVQQIVKKCGVSYDAAKLQLEKFRQEEAK